MSHFTCLVVTDSPAQVEEALQPFHEYECRDGVYGRETNPQAKWDWWVIGGRWSGLLKTKDGTGTKGRTGIMGSEFDSKGIDQCSVSDLDLDAMKLAQQQSIVERRKWAFSDALKRCKESLPEGASFMLEPDAFEEWDLLSKRAGEAEEHLRGVWEQVGKGCSFSDFIDGEKLQGCPRAITLRLAHSLGYSGIFGVEYGKTMQEAVDVVAPICTFAVLMDGVWYERGSMGWWGSVSDEDGEWELRFRELFGNLDNGKCITVVDCHI